MAGAGLRRFVRSAELYGTAGVFEQAARQLGSVDLGRLAVHLRRVDAEWKLSRAQAMGLAVALATSGVPDVKIRRMAGISQPTVRKARCRAASGESFEGVGPIGPRAQKGRENRAVIGHG